MVEKYKDGEFKLKFKGAGVCKRNYAYVGGGGNKMGEIESFAFGITDLDDMNNMISTFQTTIIKVFANFPYFKFGQYGPTDRPTNRHH